MTNNISNHDWEAISAYLDGELNNKERMRLEARLQGSAELRRAADDLRRMRLVLRSQPKVKAPRNFTLTPQMAGIRQRPAPRAYPFLRLASAIASILFVMVLASDLLLGTSRYGVMRGSQPSIMSAPQSSEQAPMAAQPAPDLQPQATTAAGFEEPQNKALMAPLQTPSPGAEALALTATPEAPSLMSPSLGAAALPTGTPAEDTVPPAAGVMSAQEAPLSPTGEAIIDQQPEPTLQAEQQLYQEQTRTTATEQPANVFAWRLAESILVLVALATGVIAYFLRKSVNQ